MYRQTPDVSTGLCRLHYVRQHRRRRGGSLFKKINRPHQCQLVKVTTVEPLSAYLKRLNSLSNWSWPAKFLIGAAISAAAGGGLLSFLLENATHAYALTYGFRPPVEGIPYLRTLVSSGSALLLLAAAMLFAVIVGIFGGLARLASRLSRGTGGIDPSSFSTPKAILASLTLVLLSYALMTYAIHYQKNDLQELGPYCGWPLISCEPAPADKISHLLLVLSVWPVAYTLFRPAMSWLAASGFVVAYYIYIGASILPPEGYARLLRSTGFGGGISVSVDFQGKDTGCDLPNLAGQLLLRTSETLILLDSTAERIREVPSRCVLRLEHKSGGMSSLPYKLPQKNPLFARQKHAA